MSAVDRYVKKILQTVKEAESHDQAIAAISNLFANLSAKTMVDVLAKASSKLTLEDLGYLIFPALLNRLTGYRFFKSFAGQATDTKLNSDLRGVMLDFLDAAARYRRPRQLAAYYNVLRQIASSESNSLQVRAKAGRLLSRDTSPETIASARYLILIYSPQFREAQKCLLFREEYYNRPYMQCVSFNRVDLITFGL